MQFSSIILLPVLAAIASSAPAPAPAGALADTQASAATSLKTLEASGCNALS